ncbi:DUF2868 domain-containing protein [Neisseria leonii]|uniref:DUF2868 domain-containing protein n=1 Tax=Neisseria leonii TaxID=2995413 RepID=UPI0030CD78AA
MKATNRTVGGGDYRLTELVRLLESHGYLFDSDPALITAHLRNAAAADTEKLVRRARMLDRDGRLAAALARVESSSRRLTGLLTLLWFVLGGAAGFGLMQQSGLNFFVLLTGVLGMNSLMFVLWLLFAAAGRKTAMPLLDPAWLVRGRDAVGQAVARLYGEMWQRPQARWQAGALGHRFWLASLGGMLGAVLLLLSVRQYTFTWESTLFSDGHFAALVSLLGWLPAKLGFPVPDAAAVAASRQVADAVSAVQWGGLLVGSMVCYGLLPRAAAWLFCRMRVSADVLPVSLPYYRRIIETWQRQVVDADSVREKRPAVQPKAVPAGAQRWAVVLDVPWPDAGWWRYVLGEEWLDQGVAAGRGDTAALKAALAQTPVQLLIGVRLRSVPDRGILRRITELADAAQGGAVVQLLAEKPQTAGEASAHNAFSDGLETYMQQWRQALDERSLPYLNPPFWAATRQEQ